jgi:hypothetical protein
VNGVRLLVCAALLAALTPFAGGSSGVAGDVIPATLPPWPHELQGRALTRVPLAESERRFLAGFPGDVARFTDGERDVILRWVTQATRRLHPADDCYRAWGYAVSTPTIRADRDGVRWRCFTARKDGRERRVCEHVRDTEGAHWSDVSSWYWAATLDRSPGPWLVTTVSN